MISKKLKQEIDTVINQYIKARIKFYQMQETHLEYLKGNDNVIGVIGDQCSVKKELLANMVK